MANTASASEVQKNFGAFHNRALTEPISRRSSPIRLSTRLGPGNLDGNQGWIGVHPENAL